MLCTTATKLQICRGDSRALSRLPASQLGSQSGRAVHYYLVSALLPVHCGLGDSKYVIVFDPLLTGHVIRRMRSGRVRVFNGRLTNGKRYHSQLNDGSA